MTPIGVWTWDFEKDLIFGDEIVSEYFGFSGDEAVLGAPLETFMRAIHDDDRERQEQALTTALNGNGKLVASLRVHTMHLGLRRILVCGRCFFGDAGHATHFAGWISDLEDAKEANPETLVRVQHIIADAKRSTTSPSIKYMLDLALSELRHLVTRRN